MGIDKDPEAPNVTPHTNLTLDLPAIPFATTKIADHWTNLQGTQCEDVEMDYFRCVANMGVGRARVVCKDYFADFRECVTMKKTVST